jgi:hypothetical protein
MSQKHTAIGARITIPKAIITFLSARITGGTMPRKIYMSSRVDCYQKPNGRAKFGGFACRIRSENTFDTFRSTKSYGHHAMLKETCKIKRPENQVIDLGYKKVVVEFKGSDSKGILPYRDPRHQTPSQREGKPSQVVVVETTQGKITRCCSEKDNYLIAFGVVYSRRSDGIFRPKESKHKVKAPKTKVKVNTEKHPNEYKRVIINGKSYRVIRKTK